MIYVSFLPYSKTNNMYRHLASIENTLSISNCTRLDLNGRWCREVKKTKIPYSVPMEGMCRFFANNTAPSVILVLIDVNWSL